MMSNTCPEENAENKGAAVVKSIIGNSMKERIALEVGDMKPKEVQHLILDNCRSETLDGLTKEYEELEVCSMINIGLKSLEGFPSFPKLTTLELSDNKLTGGLEHLKGCTALKSLKLCGNNISDITLLEPLKDIEGLASLDLIECPIAETATYRDDVFQKIPQLTFLDGIDKEGNAEPDSDEDYEYDEEEERPSDYDSEDEEGEEEVGDEDDEEGDEEEEEEDEENPSKRVKLDGETNGEEAQPTEEGDQPAAEPEAS